ncbi:hypothetical protein [Sphingobacterium sp. 1.A.5]|uniref:DUF6712 family protein n=1 Tax=Sphingobacterium sp. 1.A.5 TaxID=2044604 RepID=UPI000C0BECB2|nr:hypothetical protein [Sphingobacterium sp. 1.A.5]
MAKFTLFISERTIKDNSIIEENIESKLLRIVTKEIQQLELLPILGQDLYTEVENEVLAKIEDKDYIIKDDINILLKTYIQDFLIYGVLLNITTSLNYKYTNKGTLNITDANADNIVLGEIESIKKYYRSKYDSYRMRLVEYVNKSCSTTGDIVAPFSTGWYIKDEPNYVKIYEDRANKTGNWKGWKL